MKHTILFGLKFKGSHQICSQQHTNKINKDC